MMSFNIPANETPDQRAMRMQQAQSAQAPAPMPTDLGSGIQSVAQALMARDAERQAQFPVAPAGGEPMTLGTRVGNFIGGGFNKGLY